MARRRYRQSTRPPALVDPELRAVEVLLGPGANTVLRRALGVRSRRPLGSVRRRQVRYVPGRSIVVEFELGAPGVGGRADSIVVIAAGIDTPDARAVEVDGVPCRWWRFPDDPFLPGLVSVLDPNSRQALLGDRPIGAADAAVRTRSYRATRRAVVEVNGDAERVFVRAVRPSRALDLVARHESASVLPLVAPILAAAPQDGLLVVGASPGRTLRGAIRSGWDRYGELDGLMDTFAELPLDRLPPVEAPLRRLRRTARLLDRLVPGLPDVVDRLGDLAPSAVGEPRMVHGDLHTNQILVDPATGALSGLVDLDTFGLGDEYTDRASLLAQLVVLADLDERFVGVRDDLTERWRRQVDPEHLAIRTAIRVAALAPGPFRTQQPGWPTAVRRRLALADALLPAAPDR